MTPDARAEVPATIAEADGRMLGIVAARAADEKLGIDPVVLDMEALLSVVDAFVVVAGRNARHVDALVDDIEAATKATFGRGPNRIEGRSDGRWVLLDYGDAIIHVFDEETRAFYDLEHLWSSAPRVAWQG